MFSTIKRGLVLLFGLLAICVLVFNSFGIEPALRAILGNIQQRTGTQVSFASASGNLLTGRLSVNGVTLKREAEGRNAFQLEVASLTADLAILRLADPVWQLDRLDLLGVKGDFKIVERKEGAGAIAGGRVYEARRVLVQNAELTFVNYKDVPEGISTQVQIEKLNVDEYRSDWSLYDLLYRSELSGTVDEHPFTFSREVAEGTQKVTWHLTRLDLAKWSRGWALRGALAVAGPAEVLAVHSWPVEQPYEIQQHWKIASTSGKTFEFDAAMKRGAFEGAQSLSDTGLGEVLAKGIGSKVVGGLRNRFEDMKARILGIP